ncbi:hypothetical protein N7528_009008 [Penicillium herquei]|nr:hypothetical protein N7528_009008 [Penicillium herquei]
MRVVFQLVVLAVLIILAHAIDPSFDIELRSRATAQLTSTEIIVGLGPELSVNSSIYAQNDPRWFNATERWQAYSEPGFLVVVEPATEADVPIIVCINLPALTGSGHGSTVTLGRLKNGIEISMAKLNWIEISEDETSGFFGGGVYDGQVIDELWEEGFVTGTSAQTLMQDES